MKKICMVLIVVSLFGTMVGCNVGEISKKTETSSSTSTNSSEWKQFLGDYEKWVDSYVEVMKKYKDNPTDTSILEDYTKMATEITEWTTKAEKVQLELENDSEATKEYLETLSRIVEKFSSVASETTATNEPVITSTPKNRKPVPNVMGMLYSDAKKVLEAKGFLVTEAETDASLILPYELEDRAVKKGEVFKVNEETDPAYSDFLDYDDVSEIAPDNIVIIYYAKRDYKGED